MDYNEISGHLKEKISERAIIEFLQVGAILDELLGNSQKNKEDVISFEEQLKDATKLIKMVATKKL